MERIEGKIAVRSAIFWVTLERNRLCVLPFAWLGSFRLQNEEFNIVMMTEHTLFPFSLTRFSAKISSQNVFLFASLHWFDTSFATCKFVRYEKLFNGNALRFREYSNFIIIIFSKGISQSFCSLNGKMWKKMGNHKLSMMKSMQLLMKMIGTLIQNKYDHYDSMLKQRRA